MSVSSVVLCLFGITAIVILGWPEGRDIGGILQPNIFAAPLLAGLVFSQFRPGLVGIIVRILCLAMIALVSSRFALIGCIIAILLYEMTYNPLSPAKIPAILIAVVAAIAFWPQIAGILALDDSSRGFSSGFSGRDERWQLAFDTIADNPLGIGFKRSIGDESGHNGYLKLLLEFGIPGGGLLICLIAYSFIVAGIDALRPAERNPQQHRFHCARFGGLGALLFGAFFQPQVFSLGDTFAVCFLLLLFKARTRSSLARDTIARSGGTPVQLY